MIEQIRQGIEPKLSPEMHRLAQKVIESLKQREGEDINKWAEELAEDLVAAGESENEA